MENQHRLWYLQPARDWHEALPVGNGILGGMVFGGIERERVQLNEDSLWSGGFVDRNNPDSLECLPEVRRLLAAGKLREAEVLAKRGLTGVPDNMRTYQTLGTLLLETGAAMAAGQASPLYPDTGTPFPEAYQRSLELETATAHTRYTLDGVEYRREVFASAPDGVLVMRLSADRPGALTFHAKLERGRLEDHAGRFFDHSFRQGGDTVGFDGMAGGAEGIGFCCMMKGAAKGGSLRVVGEYLCVEGADEAVLLLSAATTYRHADPRAHCEGQLAAAAARGCAALQAAQQADHKALYGRCALALEGDAGREALPTDLRLAAYRAAGGRDPGLEALLFHYGRYLLICSSRPGALPANLQGIWCYQYAPKWDSKYTININAQMNYWAAESCNLPELHLPFFDLMERMYPNGVETAKRMYGCGGWMAHHNTDLWGDTAPQDTFVSASFWVLGAAWMATHVWEHYRYTGDTAFLEGHYHLMREACAFLLAYMVEDAAGRLVISPTSSPENTYRLPNGQLGQLCAGCTMDSQIVRRLYLDTLAAAAALGREEPLAEGLRAALEKLPPTEAGPDGRIMEWPEPYEEPEPGHRHISQLYGLYPGRQISVFETPALAQAARRTLEARLKNGGGHTGWSRVWITLFWARLLDGEQVGESVRSLLGHSVHPNLFGDHPPFQIDGNLGFSAAVAEALVQHYPDRVALLPALPPAWRAGQVRGLRLPGGIEADLCWREGRLERATLRAGADTELALWYGGKTVALALRAGQPATIAGSLFA